MSKMQTLRKTAFLLAVTMLFLSLASSAFAHATTLWCYVENNRVYVEGFFMGGNKVQKGTVVVVNNKGEKILEGITDKEGKFDFDPPYQGDMTILLKVDQAHDADFELTEQDFLDAAAEME
ncbi:Nickel transport protein [Candidatus Electrothrix laxa]